MPPQRRSAPRCRNRPSMHPLLLVRRWMSSRSPCGAEILPTAEALRNALLVEDIYKGWQCRFYADSSVPSELLEMLRSLNADIVMQDEGQPAASKLCWRFQVANDPNVGR